MQNVETDTFTLDIFEGPLAFLLHLIQKSEIDISDVPIQEITKQYLTRLTQLLTPSVDQGAEFIGMTAMLLWLKSKMLLPVHTIEEELDEDLDPNFEIIHKLLEYCRFKESAKQLSERELSQSVYHIRGVHAVPEAPKALGIEHLSLEDLTTLFENVLEKVQDRKRTIREEKWRVCDKIHNLRSLLRVSSRISFGQFFSSDRCKEELIVTFLAVLELMKIGEIFVGKEIAEDQIYIFSKVDNDGA